MVGNGKMSFMGTAEIGTDTFSHLLGREQPGWFDNSSFAMHPFGFNRVEPGTLDGQITRQHAHAFLLPLDLLSRPILKYARDDEKPVSHSRWLSTVKRNVV
jgi:hypothetical protein